MIDAIERLYRRILMMVGRGKVTTGNDAGVVQFLQIQLGADEIRDDIPRLAEFGFASMPPPGSDAVLVFSRGDRSSGVVIATGNQTYRLKNLAPGEVALYDAFGKIIKFSQTGIDIEAANQPVTVNGAASVTVNVSGAVTVNAGGVVTVKGSEVDLVGTGGTAKGVVQADCVCAFTGQPHPMVSATVKGSV